MVRREATCSCGLLRLVCDGEPVRISICHCLACQRRTGSPFGVQAWFGRDRVSVPPGFARRYERTAESGRTLAFHFCPACGSTVFWQAGQRPDLLAVAVGAFADPAFPKPAFSVWERRQHPWTAAIAAAVADHADDG